MEPIFPPIYKSSPPPPDMHIPSTASVALALSWETWLRASHVYTALSVTSTFWISRPVAVTTNLGMELWLLEYWWNNGG